MLESVHRVHVFEDLMIIGFHHCKGHSNLTFEQTSYRGNTAGHVPMLSWWDICRWWKNHWAHQYWWLSLMTNNPRFSHLTSGDVPPMLLAKYEVKKKFFCCYLYCWRCRFASIMERAWSRFPWLPSRQKSFSAPPAAAQLPDAPSSLSYISNFCHCGRRMTQNNPHFVTRWFMIIVLPWYPGALWWTKLVFFLLFSFLPVFVAGRNNWHYEIYNRRLFWFVLVDLSLLLPTTLMSPCTYASV